MEFYASWCDHCKKLKPVWKKVATALKSEGVVVGMMDINDDATKDLRKIYYDHVKGYPTILFFPAGTKDLVSYDKYEGGRTEESMIRYAKEKKDTLKPLEIN